MRALWLFAAAALLNGVQVATGPEIGAKVPAFDAKDSHGHQQNLHSIVGPKGALLVFFRSADW